MSGISSSDPFTLIESRNRGADIATYKSRLDCVMQLINNGGLGTAIDPSSFGWASDAHAEAVGRVIRHAVAVADAIAKQQAKDAAWELQERERNGSSKT